MSDLKFTLRYCVNIGSSPYYRDIGEEREFDCIVLAFEEACRFIMDIASKELGKSPKVEVLCGDDCEVVLSVSRLIEDTTPLKIRYQFSESTSFGDTFFRDQFDSICAQQHKPTEIQRINSA